MLTWKRYWTPKAVGTIIVLEDWGVLSVGLRWEQKKKEVLGVRETHILVRFYLQQAHLGSPGSYTKIQDEFTHTPDRAVEGESQLKERINSIFNTQYVKVFAELYYNWKRYFSHSNSFWITSLLRDNFSHKKPYFHLV